MDIFSLFTLFGGLAMFLYGMRVMGDALKEGSSGTLKSALEKVTNNTWKTFVLGALLTALIQSSTATIVITSGLVGAGILSLHQSLGIIIGANVGTTMTGQIIRLLDVDGSSGSWIRIFQPSSLAPIALIVGMFLIMGFKFKNSNTYGNILIGFGVLFTGLMNMTSAVDVLSETGVFDSLFMSLSGNPIIGYAIGATVAFILQSSSATIGILQAFSASGQLVFKAVYAVIVGVYLGDCVTTAIVCSIGAKEETRRVGIVNILYNLSKSVLILAAIFVAHAFGLLDGIWNETVNSGIIANANSIFNIVCAIVLLPVVGGFEKLSYRIVKDKPEPENKYKEKFDSLNPVFYNTPALALGSCYEVLCTMLSIAKTNIAKAQGLLYTYDQNVYDEIVEEEGNLDLLTDRVSQYIAALMPHLLEEEFIVRLNQYYKMVAEFERLGDHALNIADSAKDMKEKEATFSEKALKELNLMGSLNDEILAYATGAFEKRDEKAAYHIEPLEHLADDLVNALRDNHLARMANGTCSVYADSNFLNLLVDLKRISDICSNVGIATVVRVKPELAKKEHDYFTSMHSGHDERFNLEYNAAHKEYFHQLYTIEDHERE